jgi:tricorn protease-like protein
MKKILTLISILFSLSALAGEADSLNIYPLPARNVINIKKTDDDTTRFTIVLRKNGKVVMTADKVNQLMVNDLPNGEYVIEIADDKRYLTAKPIQIHN